LKGAAVEDDKIITLLEQKLDEKFREMTLHLERMQGEFTLVKVRFIPLENKLERLTDEVTLPSGKVTQRFAALEERIAQLGGKARRPSAANKRR
jgi:hypothetical protein